MDIGSIILIALGLIGLSLLAGACLKAASDSDDYMGYD